MLRGEEPQCVSVEVVLAGYGTCSNSSEVREGEPGGGVPSSRTTSDGLGIRCLAARGGPVCYRRRHVVLCWIPNSKVGRFWSEDTYLYIRPNDTVTLYILLQKYRQIHLKTEPEVSVAYILQSA